MLELSGVKAGELIPAKQFTHLVTAPRARRSAPRAPLPCIPFRRRLNSRWNRTKFEVIRDYAQQNWQATPQTVLTTAQVQDAESDLCSPRRAGRRRAGGKKRSADHSPLFAPVVETFRTLSARPGLMLISLLIALAIFWLVA